MGISAALTLAGLGGYSWRIEPHWLEFVTRDLAIRNLPAVLHGRTLAQISDLHIGARVDSSYIINSLRRVNALKPDLIAITGDFMTCSAAEQVPEVERVMRTLALPPLGCFAILGNHDYGRNWSNPEAVGALLPTLQRLGIQVLRNTSALVAGLQIIGIDDLWGMNFQPEQVLSTLDLVAPSLALCHNPDAADLPIWNGYRGWILSGHTHGGQVKPPFLPPPLLPVKNPRYVAGVVDAGDGRTLYISRGLGYLHRVRLNVRPEITLFTLKPA